MVTRLLLGSPSKIDIDDTKQSEGKGSDHHTVKTLIILYLTLLDISYFLVDFPPPGKHASGTFMSSNVLVTHQAHKNGQF